MKINIKKSKIITTISILLNLIILINPIISATNYIEIEREINKEKIIKTYINFLYLNNELLIFILDLIILILQTIIIIPIFIVEDIIDIIWDLIQQIEDPIFKKIFTFFNNIIEYLWYICLGFYFPIIILVYILDTIRDSIKPD